MSRFELVCLSIVVALGLLGSGCSKETPPAPATPEATSPPNQPVPPTPAPNVPPTEPAVTPDPAPTPPPAEQAATPEPPADEPSTAIQAPPAEPSPAVVPAAKLPEEAAGLATESVAFYQEPNEMPAVVFTDAQAGTSKIKVGDAFPELALADLEGVSHELATLRGDKLTVVVLWQADNPYSVFELKDVGEAVAAPLAASGVKVVGVNVRDPLEAAKTAAATTATAFPQLHDADGKLMDALATARLPRTYLLDSDGKVVWFDLEYSQETRRHLLQAIHYLLKQ